MSKLRGLLALLSLLAILPACTSPSQPSQPQPSSQAGEPHKGGTLRISWLGNPPKVLHPYPEPQDNTETLGDVWTLMGSGLIDLNWDTLDYRVDPDQSMAKALPTVSPDGRTFTYTLRDDLKWSDGQPLTSADFQFAWDNASKPENDWVGLDDAERIESFQTPDPHTIVVTLKEPLARFIAVSTSALIGPVPKHIWAGKPWLDPTGNPEIVHPTVVSGPYILKELSAERVVLVRNQNYWGKQPLLDEVDFLVANPQTVLSLVKTNQADWAKDFPPSQYADAKRDDSLNVIDWNSVAGLYRDIEFNLKRPALADKRFREALVRVFNRQDFIQFEDNLAVPQYGLMTADNTKWVNPNVEKYDYDPNRAKQLLQDAGYRLDGSTLRDPSGQPVKLEVIFPTTSQPRQKMAAYVQQQWKQLGIDTVVTGLEFNTYVERTQQKDFDVSMGSWGAPLDPDDLKTQIKTGAQQNNTSYSNPRVDQLLDQGKVEQDDQKRKQIYDEVQKLVVDDLPIYYTVTLKKFTAFDKKVGGVKPSKGGDLLQSNNMQILTWYIAQ